MSTLSFAESEVVEDSAYLGNLTMIASVNTPVEAKLLKALLDDDGIPATVVGSSRGASASRPAPQGTKYRLMVPASLVDDAVKVLNGVDVSQHLDGTTQPNPLAALEAAQRNAPTQPKAKAPVFLWNPQLTALLSLVLTPVFGCTLLFLNSRILARKRLVTTAALWLGASVVLTAIALTLLAASEWSWELLLSMEIILAVFVAIWYLFAGQEQQRYIRRKLASRFAQKPLWAPIGVAFLGLILAGVFIATFSN